MLDLLVVFIVTTLTVISLITISNIVLFPRLQGEKLADESESLPFVSIMIPARNEAHIIGETIKNLLNQTYPSFEIILLDDNSVDGTSEIAFEISKNDSRLMIMHGHPLPEGWLGKNWACHQMAEVAHGDILIFTDADVQWSPDALSTAIAELQTTQADLLSIWSTQHTVILAERLTVPLMALVILGYLPIIGVHNTPLVAFSAANGQCMIWRRQAYDLVGGHRTIYDNVLEDVTLARLVKAKGLRLRMADGNKLINCRMYDGWESVRNGYAKNILAGYGNSVIALILATIFHWLIFLFPLIAFIVGWLTPIQAIPLIALGLLIRAITAKFTHQRMIDAILMPVSVVLMTIIALQAIWWHFRYGGPKWKGRFIKQPTRNASPIGLINTSNGEPNG